METLEYVRTKCAYCFKGLRLSICSCGISLCAEHTQLHTDKFACTLLCDLEFDNSENIVVRSLSDLVTEDIEKAIVEKVRNKLLGDGAFRNCSHIHQITHTTGKISAQQAKCAECDIRTNLWICLRCGHIGCGRKNAGQEGNGHALKHFTRDSSTKDNEASSHGHCLEHEGTGDCEAPIHLDGNSQHSKETPDTEEVHPVVAHLESLSENYLPQVFCYSCDSFVDVPPKLRIIFEPSSQREPESNGNNDLYPTASDTAMFTGIKNTEQTCYIASVLHLVSYPIWQLQIDVAIHYLLCEEMPLKCFCCQFVRILAELQKGIASGSESRRRNDGIVEQPQVLDISDFLDLVYNTMPLFTPNVQQDSIDFLYALMERLSIYEDSMLIPKISSVFAFELETLTTCTGCSRRQESTILEKVLLVSFKENLADSVASYFASGGSPICNCGGELHIKVSILSLPLRLLVGVKRCKFVDGSIQKINQRIVVDRIDVTKFAKKPTQASKFLEERNDLFGSREDSAYNIRSAIIHIGESAHCGHNIWAVKHNGECYLVNDGYINFGNVERIGDGFLFMCD